MSTIYHAEIPVNLAYPSRMKPCLDQMFYGDNNSHVFTALVADTGNPEAGILTGTVSGVALRADGVTVPLEGKKGDATVPVTFDGITANATPCSVTLPQAAFAVPGTLTISIKITSGSDVITVLAMTGTVIRAETDSAVDPGEIIPDLASLQAAAGEALSAAEDALDAAADAQEAADLARTAFSIPAKEALLALLAKAAYTDDDAAEALEDFRQLLIGEVVLVSIEATFTPGGQDFYPNDSLNDLKPYVTVTGTYSDGYEGPISNFNLYGTLELGTCTITAAVAGKTDTFTVTVVEIPTGYTELAYLTGTGTQYINTGEKWSGNSTYELKLKGMLTDKTYANWFIGALHSGDGTNHVIGLNNTANASTVFFRYGTGGGTTGHDFTPDSATEYTVVQEANVCKLNGVTHSSYDAMTYTMAETIYLFARNNKGTTDSIAKCSIKSFKLWNGSGDLVLDLVPCLDDESVPCMFDKVSHETLYNAGSGTFSYVEVS